MNSFRIALLVATATGLAGAALAQEPDYRRGDDRPAMNRAPRSESRPEARPQAAPAPAPQPTPQAAPRAQNGGGFRQDGDRGRPDAESRGPGNERRMDGRQGRPAPGVDGRSDLASGRTDNRGPGPDARRNDGRPGNAGQFNGGRFNGGQFNGRPDGGQPDRGRFGDRGPDGRGFGGQAYNGRGYDGRVTQGWRNDRRYDWRGYREQHRDIFRGPRYVPPRGYGYGYRPFFQGYRLDPFFYDRSYWIDDPWAYRLPLAEGPYRWVRYYNDVLLVDLRTGVVVDMIQSFFW